MYLMYKPINVLFRCHFVNLTLQKLTSLPKEIYTGKSGQHITEGEGKGELNILFFKQGTGHKHLTKRISYLFTILFSASFSKIMVSF